MPLPDLAEAAAEAFTEGWLLSGCDREFTEAEFRAAIGSALDCGHHPGVLESTLTLGSLTGTWKTVYDRRERLLRKHLKAVLAAWNACMAGLDPRDMVRQFRSVMNLAAEAVTADPQKQWWKDAATTAAIAWLLKLKRTEGYPALVAAVEDAIRSGMAEGEADALALAASRQGKTGFSIAKAFRAAYDRLAGDGQVSQQAADAVTAIVNGAAGDVGRTLAAQAGDGGSEDQMTSAVGDTVTGNDVRSVKTILGDAIWAAAGAAALGLFTMLSSSSAGVGSVGGDNTVVLVDWMSEPGACVICQENTANGPYLPQDVPPYLAHPNCRCWLASNAGLPAWMLSSFLD